MRRQCLMCVVVAATVVLVSVMTPAVGEMSLDDWWESEFGPGTYPGDGIQVGDRWPNHLDAWYVMELEEAGSADTNIFGWYDATIPGNPGATYEIFAGADPVGATKRIYFDGVDSFGFYINPRGPSGDPMYTEDDANADNFRAAWVFDHPTAEFGGWIIAWEDRNWGVPGDHNDMVVSIEKTPELPPSALLGLSMLPLGIAYLRGRRRKED